MSALDLLCTVTGDPDYTVHVPSFNRAWLNSNDRGSWRKHSPLVRDWRHAASWAAIGGRVPPLRRAYVLAELRFLDRRRRDPGNWYPTVKAVVDGFVEAGVFFDDSAAHVVGPDLRLGPLAHVVPAVYIHLWRLPDV